MAAPPPSGSSRERERVGNYLLGSEIGRGSFATVLRGYKVASREVVAIKVVQRAKMTSKLLENLEAEIAILKAIHHPNIVGLEDCLKMDERIYLIMDYCSGGDLSFYIKKRGRLPTLEYVPPEGGPKRYWLHPEEGGLDEVVVKCFLGQLSAALKFLRSQNLIHRDIKPQNLLLQPPSAAQIEAGHPLGIPILKVADFGFARFLDGASMAETLCGSPLYMAPEILRYEKYDAKADLWSVGTVLFEMSVGRPPFKAQNHVELLKKIERGEDHIRFPDEKSSWNPISVGADGAPVGIPQQPVSKDVKALIKRLLKRNPVQRISFSEFFKTDIAAAYQDHMNRAGAEEPVVNLPQPPPSMMPNASTPPAPSEITARVASAGRLVSRPQASASNTPPLPPTRTMPIATRPAPALPPFALPLPASPPVGDSPLTSTPPISASPISVAAVRMSSPLAASPPPLPTVSRSPVLGHRPQFDSGSSSQVRMTRQPSFEPRYVLGQIASRSSIAGEPSVSEPRRASAPSGSPARPTMRRHGSTTASSSLGMFDYEEDEAGQDYVVIEKRTVEINSLADELDAASHRSGGPTTVARRRSSRSLLSRPLSALTLSRPHSAVMGGPGISPPQGSGPSTSPQSVNSFALSITPPFAISSSPSRPSPLHHMQSHTSSLTRPISIPHSPSSYNSLSGRRTPQHAGSAGSNMSMIPSQPQRYGSSPSSGGVLARAISLASARLFGGPTSASIAAAGAGVVARASARRKALIQSGEADPAEESLINQLEDLAQKSFVVFEFADTKIGAILSAASGATSHMAGTPVGGISSNQDSPGSGSSSGFQHTVSQSPVAVHSQAFQRRRSSFNSTSESEVSFFRPDVVAAEALALYLKALAFLQKGMESAKSFWQSREGSIEASVDLNEVVQWFRARFNDCSDKAEFVRGRCTEEPTDVSALAERLLYEKAMDLWRNAAIQEALSEDPIHTERAYDTAIFLFKAILDDTIRDGQPMDEDDCMSIEKFVAAAQKRLESVRKRMATASSSSSSLTPPSITTPSAYSPLSTS